MPVIKLNPAVLTLKIPLPGPWVLRTELGARAGPLRIRMHRRDPERGSQFPSESGSKNLEFERAEARIHIPVEIVSNMLARFPQGRSNDPVAYWVPFKPH